MKTALRLDVRTALIELGNEATAEQIAQLLRKKVSIGVVNRSLKALANKKRDPKIPVPYIRHLSGEGAKKKWKIFGQKKRSKKRS